MDNRKKSLALSIFAFFLVLLISGCAGWTSSDESTDSTQDLVDFAGVPVPNNFTLDRSKSFVYESGNGVVKVGRLFYSGWYNMDEVISYYQSAMINRGWKLINSIDHNGKILNYQKEGWACTLNIQSGWLKSYVEVQIGPK